MAENTFTIRGAEVIDGTDKPATRDDLLIVDGYIAKVGSLLKSKERLLMALA
jgi:N-acyl-D-aspartate/D-glutamate deacylase